MGKKQRGERERGMEKRIKNGKEVKKKGRERENEEKEK